MSNIAIKAENISKQYRLGQVGTGTLHQDLKRWWWEIRGKGDPFAKIGEVNDRTKKGNSDFVWALKDINFEIEQGSAVGIIGKNGAGKSTLLKILSKITSPTTGIIKSRGRIASLLEVGTGFHPDLTGRENIFLNGAILGMSKGEIRSKFDQIVDFSGVERYIDTPVKRYSSGMYVRLAFAVAAHLESEIMIVDEVLAVGDAEFQKKCLGKMNDVSKGEGRTVLFVSHNMASIRQLCSKGILLSNGLTEYTGDISDTIERYLENKIDVGLPFISNISYLAKYIKINKISINQKECNPILIRHENHSLNFCIKGELLERQNIGLEFRIFDINQNPLAFYSSSHYEGSSMLVYEGEFEIKKEVILPEEINRGVFYLSLYLSDPGKSYHMKIENSIIIDFEGYPTKTGHVFEYAKGAGFIFLK